MSSFGEVCSVFKGLINYTYLLTLDWLASIRVASENFRARVASSIQLGYSRQLAATP